MYRREFNRHDFLLTIYEGSDGNWWVRGGTPEVGQQENPLDLAALEKAEELIEAAEVGDLDARARCMVLGILAILGDDPVADIGRLLFEAILGGPVGDLLGRWSPPGDYLDIPRLALRIEVPDLVVLPWEMIERAEGGPMQIAYSKPVQVVRTVAQRPVVATQPLSVPLQVMQIDLTLADPEDSVDVPEIIADVFRWRATGLPHKEMEAIFQVRRQPIPDEYEWARLLDESQSRMDIVHLSGMLGTPDLHHLARFLPGLQAHSRIEDRLLAFLHLAKTRLLVLEVQQTAHDIHQYCLSLAHSLASRGGPPVLVSRFPHRPDGSRRFYEQFYDQLIHDEPLDIARHECDPARQAALVTGPQGEELLRLSVLVPRAYRRRDEAQMRLQQIASALEQMKEPVERFIGWDNLDWQSLLARQADLDSAEDTMRLLEGDWPLDWDHEGESSIPVVRNLSRVSEVIAAVEDLETHIEAMALTLKRAEEEGPAVAKGPRREERHVNTWLIDERKGEKVPEEEPLWLHRDYRLHVNIGPYSEESTVRNPVEIPHEALEPIYRKGGDWVQVAVYSPDFDVNGSQERPRSAMRRLWLPAQLASQPIYFSVRPKRPGLTYLRICVYYRNQLLQSLRMDARVLGRRAVTDDPLLEIPGIAPDESRRLREAGIEQIDDLAAVEPEALTGVAEVVGVPRHLAWEWTQAARRLPRLGYETYIEYTISADFQELDRLPKRAVSIFTNQVNGTHAIGVKAGDWDEVWGTEDDWTDAMTVSQQGIGDRLKLIRGDLDEIGGKNIYGFAPQDDPNLPRPVLANEGTPEKLTEALKKLAVKGYTLYCEIFSADARIKLAKELAESGQTIHVARLMEGEVLPWSIIYDQYLDIAEEPQTVCLDLLNHVDGKGQLDYHECIGQANCPLKADAEGRVVCPWGFWGIKHILEQPPQRIREGANPRGLVTQISVTGSTNMSMNVSTRLRLLKAHHGSIARLPGITQPLPYAGDDRPQDGQPAPQRGKDQILQSLRSSDIHIIYFYCHGGATEEITGSGWPKPYLSVGRTKGQRIVPENFTRLDIQNQPVYRWTEHPLVFVNGCHTAGLTPAIMGHFVQTFAELGAAGVIGTEVKVWEPLAIFFAERFFHAFLQGQSVGQILRDLRHELLRRHNPLGLVYTNYCSADLGLVKADN